VELARTNALSEVQSTTVQHSSSVPKLLDPIGYSLSFLSHMLAAT